MALQSARAYQAANAGIEWGVERVVNATSCATSTTLSPNINNFTVQVSCSLLGNYSEGLNTVNVYQITAQSEYGSYGDPGYVSRTMQVIVQ
jgi:MSHA biogenesis protein MshP